LKKEKPRALKPIDGAELLSEIISKSKICNKDREDSLSFFIYNVVGLLLLLV
jgi:hypothetical protein